MMTRCHLSNQLAQQAVTHYLSVCNVQVLIVRSNPADQGHHNYCTYLTEMQTGMGNFWMREQRMPTVSAPPGLNTTYQCTSSNDRAETSVWTSNSPTLINYLHDGSIAEQIVEGIFALKTTAVFPAMSSKGMGCAACNASMRKDSPLHSRDVRTCRHPDVVPKFWDCPACQDEKLMRYRNPRESPIQDTHMRLANADSLDDEQ